MNDKSIPDVIYSRHVPYVGYVPLQNQDCYREDMDIKYTRTKAIVELLEGIKGVCEVANHDYNQALDDAIQAIKDMK